MPPATRAGLADNEGRRENVVLCSRRGVYPPNASEVSGSAFDSAATKAFVRVCVFLRSDANVKPVRVVLG